MVAGRIVEAAWNAASDVSKAYPLAVRDRVAGVVERSEYRRGAKYHVMVRLRVLDLVLMVKALKDSLLFKKSSKDLESAGVWWPSCTCRGSRNSRQASIAPQ